MDLVLSSKYTYADPFTGGTQEFTIEVFRDSDSFVGRGLSSSGVPITSNFRMSSDDEDITKLDAVDTIISCVQGMIIGVIHSHRRKKYTEDNPSEG